MNHKPITTATIAAAERLAGVDYTTTERAQVLAKIDEQINWMRLRRGFSPDNDLGPATVFDPRIPGVSLTIPEGGYTPSTKAPPPLPDNDVDIAFAPLTMLSAWMREGMITSSRLTAIYLARLESIGAELKCVVTLTRDLAVAQAGRAISWAAARHSLGGQGFARYRRYHDQLGGRPLSGQDRRTRRRRGPPSP